MISFFQLVKKRRSIRLFKPEKIEKEKLLKILSAGLMAPTSRNTQATELVLVQNAEMLKKLSQSRPSGSYFIEKAAAAIVVCVDTNKSTCPVEDASIASITMQFQAEELDLGSCWVQIHRREKNAGVLSENYVRELLGVANNFDIVCIVALGVKNEEKPLHDEQNLNLNKIHYEKF